MLARAEWSRASVVTISCGIVTRGAITGSIFTFKRRLPGRSSKPMKRRGSLRARWNGRSRKRTLRPMSSPVRPRIAPAAKLGVAEMPRVHTTRDVVTVHGPVGNWSLMRLLFAAQAFTPGLADGSKCRWTGPFRGGCRYTARPLKGPTRESRSSPVPGVNAWAEQKPSPRSIVPSHPQAINGRILGELGTRGGFLIRAELRPLPRDLSRSVN